MKSKLKEFWIFSNGVRICGASENPNGTKDSYYHVREVSPELDAAYAECERVLEIYDKCDENFNKSRIAQRAIHALRKARNES